MKSAKTQGSPWQIFFRVASFLIIARHGHHHLLGSFREILSFRKLYLSRETMGGKMYLCVATRRIPVIVTTKQSNQSRYVLSIVRRKNMWKVALPLPSSNLNTQKQDHYTNWLLETCSTELSSGALSPSLTCECIWTWP